MASAQTHFRVWPAPARQRLSSGQVLEFRRPQSVGNGIPYAHNNASDAVFISACVGFLFPSGRNNPQVESLAAAAPGGGRYCGDAYGGFSWLYDTKGPEH